jgi:pimeloyl-ACP methyl ester carboxylesterase
MGRELLQTVRRAVALGTTALTAEALLHGRRQFEEWESLSLDDAEDGDFVTLSGGARMHYVARGPCTGSGDEPTLVLIHGLMSSAAEWARNIDALAQTHRVFAIDLVGFGFSTRITERCYSLRYFAQSVLEFLDAQGIARASLVGHSLGGGIALQIAHDAPERVDRMVLIAPGVYVFDLVRLVHLVLRVPFIPRALACRVLSNPQMHASSLRNALGDPSRLDRGAVTARERAARVKGTVDALLAMACSPHASDPLEGLNGVTAPTLILWGDRDYILPLQHGERLLRELPDARLMVLKGAGHVANEEFPESVNRLILEFMTSGQGMGAGFKFQVSS